MFRHKHPDIANFRADYAQLADFCEVLRKDMKPFYLLAFLLTANHKNAEQCFASTVEKGCKENRVFKPWVRSWIRRCLIEEAIHTVFSCSGRTGEQQREVRGDPRVSNVVNAVTALPALERFVFVMSVLEGYSSRECSLLLKCAMNTVIELRVRALCRLAASEPFSTGSPAGLSGRRESA